MTNSEGADQTFVQGLQKLVLEALPGDVDVRPVKGFKLDLSANPDFHKVYFSASCSCGVAALLSVEVASDKSEDEITSALPSLVERLVRQTETFRQMPCEMHKKMGLGPSAPGAGN